MIKFFTLAVALTVLSFFLAQHRVFGQTATPTTTMTPTPTSAAVPSPTTTVPSGAPATGFGPY